MFQALALCHNCQREIIIDMQMKYLSTYPIARRETKTRLSIMAEQEIVTAGEFSPVLFSIEDCFGIVYHL